MRRLAALNLVAALLLAGGCGRADESRSTAAVAYHLESIDGRSLPAPFGSVEVAAGVLTLEEDSTYTKQTTVQSRDALGQLMTQTDSEVGTYSRGGETLRFVPIDSGETTAAFDGRTITVRVDSSRIVYRRR